jgi:hypothetical protein
MEQSQEQIGRDVTQRERERDRDKNVEEKNTPAPFSATEAGTRTGGQVWTREMWQTREILGYGKSTLNITPHQPLLG